MNAPNAAPRFCAAPRLRASLLGMMIALSPLLLACGAQSAENTVVAESPKAGSCSAQLVQMEVSGAGSYLVNNEAHHGTVGKFAEQCSYQFPMFSLKESLGDCAVEGVTFEGSQPLPQLINLRKNFEAVVTEGTVENSSEGDLAWSWASDGLNCDDPGCLNDAMASIVLVGSELGMSMDSCPWTTVQARFELSEGQ